MKSSIIYFCIESNAATKTFLSVAEKCNTVIVDYKSPCAEKLKEITGADISVVESNIRNILKTKKLHIRIPLIHSFNDNDEALEKFIDFFNSLSGDFDVEILPYHEYGKEKWNRIGKEYSVSDGFVSKETIKKFIETLKANSIKVIKT